MASFLKKPITSIISRERPDEKGLFLKRIGSLIEEGYSIKAAIIFLSKIEKGATKSWLIAIQEGLLTGNTFQNELENLGFPERVSSQIYLAAQYGHYGQTIRQCGEQLLERLNKQKKFQSLLSYPLFLLLFLFGMLLLMRYIILPHMEVLFMNTGSEGDLYSNSIVLLVYYSPQLLVLGLVMITCVLLMLNYKLSKKSLIARVQFFMKFPILKSFLKDYYSHFFFFEWGQLIQNGCSFHDIVHIMQGKDASTLLKETGGVLSKQMLLGHSLEEAIYTLPFFHEEGVQVITHGESLGKLGTEMLIYADYCENQLDSKIEKYMSRMQPVIFGLVGLMIMAIYAALMLPILSLMEGF